MTAAGKVALVTGGGRGIGKAIATALAEAGVHLVLLARTAAQAAATGAEISRRTGVRCLALQADVSDPAQVERAVARGAADIGPIEILVNNAGIYGAIGPFARSDLAEWRSAIEVNLLGTVHATRAVLPSMIERRWGRIVNVAGAGIGGPAVTPRISAYAASKAAVVQLTETLAKEVASDGILVNAIAPGAVTTEITSAVIAAGPERAGKDFYQRNLRQRDEGGDAPELAARLAVFLASEECRITGKLLSAKWDRLEGLDAEAVNASSRFALRRIDGVLFDEVKKR